MSASGIWACGTAPSRWWWGFTEVPVIGQTHWWLSDRISLWTFYNKGRLCGGLSGEILELRMGREMSIRLSLFLEPSPWQDTTTVPRLEQVEGSTWHGRYFFSTKDGVNTVARQFQETDTKYVFQSCKVMEMSLSCQDVRSNTTLPL